MMFSKWKVIFVLLLAVFLVSGFALMASAAPSLDIRHDPNGPILGGPNGPIPSEAFPGAPDDKYSETGQWFWNLGNVEDPRSYDYRTHEFYDNQHKYGGSEKWNTKAIEGYVGKLGKDSFLVHASITNDTLWGEGEYDKGENSHKEYWGEYIPAYKGPMYDVKLTTEFAGTSKEDKIWVEKYDQLAWYCDPETGTFQVPTYDFGDIKPGDTATRDILFFFNPEDEELVQFLDKAMQEKYDIFLNRTTSLKISNFIDQLAVDDGTPYPIPPGFSSDVSVFHNVPIPGAVWLFGSGLVGLIGLGRRKLKAQS